MRRFFLTALFLATASMAESSYLYRIMMVQAAPGTLLELIEAYKGRMVVYDASGDERPFWMRHSQGDRWDLLFVYPMESFAAYYSPDKAAGRKKAAEEAGMPQPEFARLFYELVAWHEEVFVEGPPLEEVKNAFEGADYFHVEIFRALPAKLSELVKERDMENAYLKELGRPQNLTFTHEQGAAWDVISIGLYRDLKHYAESADIPPEKQEAAAKAAGFEGADRIGTYLRTLMAAHHDTLAVAIR